MNEQTIDGRYTILEEIGHGGMGTVYRVRDESDGTEKALKVLDPPGLQSAHVRHFEREFLSLTDLDHPNLVHVFDFGLTGEAGSSRPYFTMELVAGHPIHRRFRPPLDFPALYRTAAGVLRALAYLHSRGFVHSDVTSANILSWREDDPEDEPVKLMDLGLLDTVRRTEAGRIRGTLGYLPPERLRGDRVDGRADLYSFGVVLYETVTGRLPFVGEPLTTIRGHLETPPTPPTHLNPEVPASLEEVILRLMEKEPSARYQSATAAVEALSHASAGLVALPGRSSAPTRLLAGRFLGRRRELDSLSATLDQARTGPCGPVLVTGEAGVGKTRLLQEFRAHAQVAGVRVVTLRCTGGPASETPLDQLAAAMSPLAGEASPTLTVLRQILKAGGEDLRSTARFRTTAAAAATLEETATTETLLLLLEDLHRADEATLDLVAFLCRSRAPSGSPSPVIVASCREEEVPRAGRLEELLAQLRDEGLLREIRLRPLSAEDCRALAASILALPDLDQSWGQALATATRGNPLHLESLLADRVAQGALSPGVEPGPPAEILAREAVPGLARDLLARRLASLPDDQREVLLAASILGEVFGPEDLNHLLEPSGTDPAMVLGVLVRVGILDRFLDTEGRLRYRFAPPALAPVAQEAQADEVRAERHARRADQLEASPPEAGQAAATAHHWIEAGVPDKAVPHLARAAEQAAGRGSLHEATGLLGTAIGILRRRDTTPTEEMCALFASRGRIRLLAGDVTGAEEDFRWMQARAEKDGHAALTARAAELLGGVLRDRGRHEASLETLDVALAHFDELGDTRGGARTLLSLAHTLAALGRTSQATERLGVAATQAGRVKDRSLGVRVQLARGDLLLREGRPTVAVEQYRQALEEADHLEDPSLLLQARLGVATGLEAENRHQEAAIHLAEAAEAAQQAGELSHRTAALTRLGSVLDRLGDHQAALAAFEEALEVARRTGDTASLAENLERLARFQLRRGRLSRAMEAADDALRWARRSGRREQLGQSLALVGAACREVGDLARSRRSLEESLGLAREIKSGRLQALALQELGALTQAEGDMEAAKTCYQESCFLARRRGDEAAEAVGMILLAEAYLESGDHTRATLALRKGTDLLSALGLHSEMAAVHLSAARLEAMRPDGDREQARREAEAALAAFEELEEAGSAWRAHHLLGRLLLQSGESEEALEHYRKAFLYLDGVASQLPERWQGPYRREPRRQAFLKEWDRLGARLGTARVDRDTSAAGPPVAAPDPVTHDLERLLEINKKLNSTLELRPLLETLVDTAVDLAQADRGLVLLGGGGHLELEVGRGPGGESLPPEDRVWSHSLATRVLDSGEPVLSADTLSDQRFSESRSVRDLQIRSVVAMPLRTRAEIAGALVLESRTPSTPFNETHLNLLGRLADQAGIALSNARLLEELRQRGKEIERLNRELQSTVDRQAADLESARIEILEKQSNLELRYRYDRIIGASPAMQKVYTILDKVVPTRIPVLVTGESGTGKELIARAVHYNGPRQKARFTTVNCAALTETLLESELFGHLKGAFTGADRSREGLFALAHGGTLFLDEVADMSPAMQAKLLRALQDGEIRPVGGGQTRKVDVRVISATNHDLKAMVSEGTFREDLLYRLNVATIHVPPLRERKEDLRLLVDHFLARYLEEQGGDTGTPHHFAGGAIRLLVLHDWPGNVRELEHEVTKLVAFARGEEIDERDVRENAGFMTPAAVQDGSAPPPVSLEESEIRQIRRALEMAGGNRTRAADLLGINRATLHRKIRRYGIE